MNACGDCDRPLPQSATRCQCGWVVPAQQRPYEPVKELRKGSGPRLTWRQRWYLENKLPFEPPKLVQCAPFMTLGGSAYRAPLKRDKDQEAA